MDVTEQLDELAGLVETARAMPMSASCIVNRAEMLEAIDAVRSALPRELVAARDVLDDRSSVVAGGREEAKAIIEAATEERTRLLSRTEVVKEATREAERIIDAAQSDAARVRREVDDYVDGRLANFEIVLNKTLATVERGRAKIHGRHEELADLADSDEAAEPLPG